MSEVPLYHVGRDVHVSNALATRSDPHTDEHAHRDIWRFTSNVCH